MDKIRIVLAKDHHMVRAAVAALLEKEQDIEVIGEIADGIELMNRIGDLNPDVLVLDAKMPNQKVIDAVQNIHEKHPNIKILVLSAHNRREYIVGVLREGAAGYVLKDDAPEMLAFAIRTVHNGEEWVSPRTSSQLIKSSITEEIQHLIGHLTPREMEVLKYMTQGKKNEEIAKNMVVTTQTINNYVRSIFSKIGVDNRVDAVLIGIKNGLAEHNVEDEI